MGSAKDMPKCKICNKVVHYTEVSAHVHMMELMKEFPDTIFEMYKIHGVYHVRNANKYKKKKNNKSYRRRLQRERISKEDSAKRTG